MPVGRALRSLLRTGKLSLSRPPGCRTPRPLRARAARRRRARHGAAARPARWPTTHVHRQRSRLVPPRPARGNDALDAVDQFEGATNPGDSPVEHRSPLTRAGDRSRRPGTVCQVGPTTTGETGRGSPGRAFHRRMAVALRRAPESEGVMTFARIRAAACLAALSLGVGGGVACSSIRSLPPATSLTAASRRVPERAAGATLRPGPSVRRGSPGRRRRRAGWRHDVPPDGSTPPPRPTAATRGSRRDAGRGHGRPAGRSERRAGRRTGGWRMRTRSRSSYGRARVSRPPAGVPPQPATPSSGGTGGWQPVQQRFGWRQQ